MSGGFSPLHARMSEITGYEAFFMSGSQVAAYVYGYPDVGLLGLNEMVESVRRITNVTDIPVFADADTGYGNAVNVYYTVQAYIRAGAAGLHIEDQEAPKKSGTLAGRRLISVEEAVGKYRAAVAAKQETRCRLCRLRPLRFRRLRWRQLRRCGAPRHRLCQGRRRRCRLDEYDDQARRDRRSVPAHSRAGDRALLSGRSRRRLSMNFNKLGVSAVLYPSLTTANGLQSTWEVLHEVKERGPVVLDEWNKKAQASKYGMVPRTQDPILPAKKIIQLEEDFIPKELQRDYDKTFGHNRH